MIKPTSYRDATLNELSDSTVNAIFLGQFFPWDGFENFKVASDSGFLPYSSDIEGSIGNYENLDNHQTGIHDYFKYLKFGFGRATDIASSHIRRGRMTRDEGLRLVRERDGKFPWFCLGKSLEKILVPLEMSVDDFVAVCDRFTNRQLFASDLEGNLIKDENGNLQKREDWLV